MITNNINQDLVELVRKAVGNSSEKLINFSNDLKNVLEKNRKSKEDFDFALVAAGVALSLHENNKLNVDNGMPKMEQTMLTAVTDLLAFYTKDANEAQIVSETGAWVLKQIGVLEFDIAHFPAISIAIGRFLLSIVPELKQ